MSVTGLAGPGPLRVGFRSRTSCGGIFAAYGVTVALLEREASGQGPMAAHVAAGSDDLHDGFPDARWTIDGEIPGRRATSTRPASHRRLQTSDGFINIAVFGGKIWERFAEAMGAPEWITDERSRTKTNRSVHRDWLNAEIEQRLSLHTSDYWIETLNEAGVACGRINNLKEVFEEPQVRHLGILQKITSKHRGEQTLMGQPVTLSRTPSTIARAAPKRGEHSEEILGEIGYDRDAIARMKVAGVF
jgi:formyl-CoA transferase